MKRSSRSSGTRRSSRSPSDRGPGRLAWAPRSAAWRASEVAHDVVAAVGAGARLVRDDGVERFDVLPLLVATDGAIRALGTDRRRLRPNIVIAGVEGLAERTWEGRQLKIGEVVI